MAREPFDIVVDCNNTALRREFASDVLTFDGIWHFKGEPKKDTRTARQNSFYWSAIVTPFYHFCRDNHIEGIRCKHDAHELLKHELLAVDVTNPETGEIWGTTVGSTTRLGIDGMSRYIEDCRDWILKRTGIDTLKYVDEGPGAKPQRHQQREAAHA